MAKKKADLTPRTAQLRGGVAIAASENENIPPGLGFPVVLVGASAGGLAAFTALLKALPSKSGMAFVLIQHLEPKHESALSILLATKTGMPVVEVSDGLAAEPDNVYIIPPNKKMTIRKGKLRLAPRSEGAGMQRPIDDFAVALAEEQGRAAIGVILSGTGSDGTYGLKAIKSAGGVTFAQEPKTAQWPAMPLNAITAGAVDFVLPPKRIALELARMGRHPYLADALEVPEGSDLDRICILLRAATGVDFRLYKQATVRRRIARRMGLKRISSLAKYAQALKQDPEEAKALADDIFIHVTSFFRDPECFQALRKRVLAKLCRNRSSEEAIRIWVAGCSTGEEVYAIAMLVLEELGEQINSTKVQIFGTDIQERAVEHARAGVYTDAAVAPISPARRKRFFDKVDHGYQIQRFVRDLCVFARHDLAKDPPFSKLDLISCRNVLIYMGPALQRRVVSMFHYALKPGGFLMLGNSESISEYSDAFTPEDRTHRIFVCKPHTAIFHELASRADALHDTHPPVPKPAPLHEPPDLRKEAEAALLEHFTPPALVVDSDLHIVHFQGDTSAYLAPATGQPSFHLLKMVRPELVVDLRAAINRARKEGASVHVDGLQFKDQGQTAAVSLEVRPLTKRGNKKRNLLVVFQRTEPPKQEPEQGAGAKRGHAVKSGKAERELASTRGYLRTLIAEHEAAQEETKAANEEVLSSNEELQSTNEELETAKEELQSSNEELITLNDELQHRNSELTALTRDLDNLLVGVDLPVLVLDAGLRVRRFTPVAGALLNLIPSDVGRLFSNIASNLDVSDWSKLFAEVTVKGRPIEREVKDRTGHHYSMRVRPYKAGNNDVEGVLVAFMNADLLAHARDEASSSHTLAQEAQRRGSTILNSLTAHVAVLDSKGTILETNQAWNRFASDNGSSPVGRGVDYLDACRKAAQEGSKDAELALEGIRSVLEGRSKKFQLEYPCHSPTQQRWFVQTVSPLEGPQGGAVVTHADVTLRKLAEATLQESESLTRTLLESTTQSVIAVRADQTITFVNGNTEKMFGFRREDLIGQKLELLIPEHLRAIHARNHQSYFLDMRSRPMGIGMDLEARHKSGTHFPVEISLNAIEVAGEKLAVAFVSDISDRKVAAAALRQSNERLQLAMDSTGIGSFEIDGETRRRNASATAKAFFGLSSDAEWNETLIRKAIHPDDVERVMETVDKALQPGGPDHFEMEFRTKGIEDGRERWLLVSGKTFHDDRGQAQRILGVSQDLTERKRMEEALRQSEERLRLAVESTGIGTFDFDPRSRKRIWSGLSKSFFGLPPDAEVDDAIVRKCIHPDDWDRVQRVLGEAMRPGGTGSYSNEFRVLGANDGRLRWISAWGRVLFDPRGEPERIVGVIQDITERRRIEEVLRQREQEVSTVLDANPDVILRVDRQQRYTYVNAMAAAIGGIPREAFIGKTHREVGLPQEMIDLWDPVFRRVFQTGKPETLEILYPSPTLDHPVAIEERFIPEVGPDGVESVLVIGTDITERKRLEKIAEAGRDEIRALAGRLLTAEEDERARVSRELHDSICQQLASLAIDMSGLASETLPPEARLRLKKLQARVVKTSDETRHIAYELHSSLLDDLGLGPSVRSLCKEFSKRLKIPVEVTHNLVRASLPRDVKSCLYRVVQESLNNVAKHSGAKHVWVDISSQEGVVTLSVRDDGAGFELEKIRGRRTLGLIGMEERAKVVGGTLTIESSPGHGTKIALVVPLAEVL